MEVSIHRYRALLRRSGQLEAYELEANKLLRAELRRAGIENPTRVHIITAPGLNTLQVEELREQIGHGGAGLHDRHGLRGQLDDSESPRGGSSRGDGGGEGP